MATSSKFHPIGAGQHAGFDSAGDFVITTATHALGILVDRADLPGLVALIRSGADPAHPVDPPAARCRYGDPLCLREAGHNGPHIFGPPSLERTDSVKEVHLPPNIGTADRAPAVLDQLATRLHEYAEQVEQVQKRLDGIRTELDGQDGLHATANGLALAMSTLSDGVAQVQGLVEVIAARGPGAAPPANVATKEYVDAALARLSATLRERIAQAMAEAIRATAPGPGMVRRLVTALRPPPPRIVSRAQQAREQARERSGGAAERGNGDMTPERINAVGAAAAAALVNGGKEPGR